MTDKIKDFGRIPYEQKLEGNRIQNRKPSEQNELTRTNQVNFLQKFAKGVLVLALAMGGGTAAAEGGAKVIHELQARNKITVVNPDASDVVGESINNQTELKEVNQALEELDSLSRINSKDGVEVAVGINLNVVTDETDTEQPEDFYGNKDSTALKTGVFNARNILNNARSYLQEDPNNLLKNFDVSLTREYGFSVEIPGKQGNSQTYKVKVDSTFKPDSQAADTKDIRQTKQIQIDAMGAFGILYAAGPADNSQFRFGKITVGPSMITLPTPDELKIIRDFIAPKIAPDEGGLMANDAKDMLDQLTS